MKSLRIFTSTLAVALAVSASILPTVHAQDIGPALDPTLMVGWTAGAAVQYDLEHRANAAAGRHKHHPKTIKPKTAVQRGKNVHLTYTPTTASKQKALDKYLARIEAQNPNTAKLMAKQFREHDASLIYHGLVADTGLQDNDVADNITAYTVLGWMIATGSGEPSPTNVRAARNQIAGVLSTNQRFSDPSLRAQLGEEIKLLFVTVHAGWQSAKREGNVEQYSEGISKIFGQQSRDTLRSLQLTNAGFVKR